MVGSESDLKQQIEPDTPVTPNDPKNGRDQQENAGFSPNSKQRGGKKAIAKVQSMPSITKEIKNFYKEKFRVEVDFHHKISYRFEKAYRLSKAKANQNVKMLNLEIIDCISEFSGYIEHDPMALFYCLYFCIYYHNKSMVEFIRQLI